MRPTQSVLLVDDDIELVETLTSVFEQAGFSVCTAYNGLQAATYLHLQRPPSVILLDIVMPGADGYAFLLEREKVQLPDTAVIVATGSSESSAFMGVDAVLRKPLDLNRLLATVYNVTTQRAAGSRESLV